MENAFCAGESEWEQFRICICRKDLEKVTEDELRAELERFMEVPLYILRMTGAQKDVSRVLNVIKEVVDQFDIQHVLVDNLQFMLAAHTEDGLHMDKFFRQERVFTQLRMLASERNVHITLVVHPRKVLEQN